MPKYLVSHHLTWEIEADDPSDAEHKVESMFGNSYYDYRSDDVEEIDGPKGDSTPEVSETR